MKQIGVRQAVVERGSSYSSPAHARPATAAKSHALRKARVERQATPFGIVEPTPRRRQILIVEDEPDLARLLQFHLWQRGFETTLAHDGRTALNEAFLKHFDLIVLDLMIPELHGLEFARLIRSAPKTRGVPILMLTALASQEDIQKGFRFGADDYVTKPFDVRELVARVNAVLSRAHSKA